MRQAHPFRSGRTAAASPQAAQARVGWSGVSAIALLCSGVALAAIPRAGDAAEPEEVQWRALGIAPLSAGGSTGVRQMPTEAVQPIDAAPDRAFVERTMVFAAGDSMHGLLARAGASYADAAAASQMIRSATARLAPGTAVEVVLGRREGAGRPIERVALRSGLGMRLELRRGESGGLSLFKLPIPVDTTPLRVSGRSGDSLYWALRSAGASPQSAAEYLQAIGREIDVGSEIGPDDRFDLVIASRRAATGEHKIGTLLYAGIDRFDAPDLQLVRWQGRGGLEWINAAALDQPVTASAAWPVNAPITSGFGYRRHPILRFARMHRGIDFGAERGTPIVAAADGQVTRAGWAGGYGRQVRIAHGGGLATSYSHMSSIAAEDGAFVRAGQVIGYVGSSGLSTGPHLHYEVYRNGAAVNPLGVRFASVQLRDPGQVAAVKARLKALLGVGVKRG